MGRGWGGRGGNGKQSEQQTAALPTHVHTSRAPNPAAICVITFVAHMLRRIQHVSRIEFSTLPLSAIVLPVQPLQMAAHHKTLSRRPRSAAAHWC